MSTDKMPQTDSIQELARFWDTHDLTEFEDQLEEVTDPVFQRETVVQINLPIADAQIVEQIAKSKGIAFADLIREWVKERVHSS